MSGIVTSEAGDKRGLEGVDLDAEYRTGTHDLINDFYVPCLRQAIRYDRAIGFFRSSIYDLTGDAVLEFALRGGRIRLICSPRLDQNDIDAIDRGYANRTDVTARAIFAEIHALIASEATRDSCTTLATLVRLKILDVRIALTVESEGIFHEKLGVMEDAAGCAVSFKGSANETWNGWARTGNVESIDVFCSWRGEREGGRVLRHQEYFGALWRNEYPKVATIPLPEIAREALVAVAKDSIEGLRRPRPSAARRSLLVHQASALKEWAARGKRGILEHATGSGKTFTALAAIKEHLNTAGPCLILVPSRLLLRQWYDEIHAELPEAAVLRAGASHEDWRDRGRLARFTSSRSASGPRIVLATMQTAATDGFKSELSQGQHLMLVADEVHQLGSAKLSNCLKIDAGPRLGLSATPTRYGDPDGTNALLDYFDGIVPPPFTLADAIKAGRLVPYQYFPHFVELSESELADWRNLTRRIVQDMGRAQNDTGSFSISERAKLMLIQRARIAKKAAGKSALAVRLLSSEYREGQRWLVYCEDGDQLEKVRGELSARGLRSIEYRSDMAGDPQGALRWFRSHGGVLVSIRCLDEGIDIPEVSHALILASSKNPRQFIQRRGRVLRASPAKPIAVVHDCLVLPRDASEEGDLAALVASEVRRALEFAQTALNRSAEADLRAEAIARGVVLSQADDEMEETDDE